MRIVKHREPSDPNTTNYPGFCKEYGKGKMALALYAGVPSLAAAFGGAVATMTISHPKALIAGAAMGGIAGFFGSVIGHDRAAESHIENNRMLTQQNVDLETGGKIVRKGQATAYFPRAVAGLLVAGTAPLAVNCLISEFEPSDNTQDSSSNVTSVDAVHPMEQNNEHIADPAKYQPVADNAVITLNI